MEAVERACREDFNRLLLNTPAGVAHDILTNIRCNSYSKIVKDMVKRGLSEALEGWPDEMKSVASATAAAAIHAREAYGDQKLSALHAALSF